MSIWNTWIIIILVKYKTIVVHGSMYNIFVHRKENIIIMQDFEQFTTIIFTKKRIEIMEKNKSINSTYYVSNR